MSLWKKLLIIGDSNTQYGNSCINNWLNLLADKLQRQCDIINRGFSGYTTRTMRLILPKIMSEFKEHIDILAGVVILLGSNDSACESNEIQHVPLDQYVCNYQWIIDYLVNCGIKKENIIIITPPKIADDIWSNVVRKEYNNDSTHFDHLVKSYAVKCRELAIQNQITYLDFYTLMDNSFDDFKDYLQDGLHLSTSGAKFLFDNLWPIINEKFIKTSQIRVNFPLWKDIKYTEDLTELSQ